MSSVPNLHQEVREPFVTLNLQTLSRLLISNIWGDIWVHLGTVGDPSSVNNRKLGGECNWN